MSNKQPLVSVIITTKNSADVIGACLASVRNQTFKNFEIILVDNNSSDETKRIAKKYTARIFNKGPERSAQRNFGAKKARGKYIFFLDSDMVLGRNVIKQAVARIIKVGEGGIIIPEESFGKGFWAKVKAWERSFYLGNSSLEAARFFPRKVFFAVGGYDKDLISGEDWDLSQRVAKKYKIGRINEFIFHDEGELSLIKTLRKKYYYAQNFRHYLKKYDSEAISGQQINPLQRYGIFFLQPMKLFRHPFLSFGVFVMKTGEYIAGAFGFAKGAFQEIDR